MVVFFREQSFFSFGGWALATSHHAGLALAGRGWGGTERRATRGRRGRKAKSSIFNKKFNLGIASN